MSHVVALCGGVGGAKLAFGLARVLGEGELTIVVNTADDFEHLGLSVSPDIDTVVYTLAGLSDRERGWGLAGETWGFMGALKRLGGEDWFNLGDHDLAMHVERTRRLAAGRSLSAVTGELARALGVHHPVVPMSDDRVRTWVETDAGRLAFQRYFVGEHCAPVVRAIGFDGAEQAQMSPAFAEALARADLAAIVICPSNPYLSIDPILSVPGVREALAQAQAPKIAVSPIVGGQALKGPAAKLMTELGVEPGAIAVARHYRGLLDGMILDETDAGEQAPIVALGMGALTAPTIMRTDADRIALAQRCLDFARDLQEAH